MFQHVSSSGSSSTPAELHVNQMQWLIRRCVIRYYVSVMWRPGMHRSVWLHYRVVTMYQTTWRLISEDHNIIISWETDVKKTTTCLNFWKTPELVKPRAQSNIGLGQGFWELDLPSLIKALTKVCGYSLFIKMHDTFKNKSLLTKVVSTRYITRRQTAMVIWKLQKWFQIPLSPIKYGSLNMEANCIFLKYK
jgi:hypothetical protein